MDPSVSHQFPPWVIHLSIYGIVVGVIIGAVIFLCRYIGERRPSGEKLRPYECGIIPVGSARAAHPVPFYLVAILFLLFDVEAVFVFCWALVARRLGWGGWVPMFIFLGLLLLGLAYVWQKGGLDWGRKTEDGLRGD